jgi:hypothetical protein
VVAVVEALLLLKQVVQVVGPVDLEQAQGFL